MSKRTRGTCWFLAVVIGVALAFAAGVGVAKAAGLSLEFKYFVGLLAGEPVKVIATRERAMNERSEQIRELIRITGILHADESSGRAIDSAIRLLGVYRAREATPALIRQLTFSPTTGGRDIQFSSESPRPRQLSYPAVGALIEIGDEKTPEQLLYRITKSENPLERELAVFVIWKLSGEERTIMLFSQARETTNDEGKPKLDEAMEFVKGFKRWPPKLKITPLKPGAKQQP